VSIYYKYFRSASLSRIISDLYAYRQNIGRYYTVYSSYLTIRVTTRGPKRGGCQSIIPQMFYRKKYIFLWWQRVNTSMTMISYETWKFWIRFCDYNIILYDNGFRIKTRVLVIIAVTCGNHRRTCKTYVHQLFLQPSTATAVLRLS